MNISLDRLNMLVKALDSQINLVKGNKDNEARFIEVAKATGIISAIIGESNALVMDMTKPAVSSDIMDLLGMTNKKNPTLD